ncbi:MAG: hypothetical protein ACP5UA_02810 [Candidatus Hydrogenedens sp.]
MRDEIFLSLNHGESSRTKSPLTINTPTIAYTTNPVGTLHRQSRKVTKSRTLFSKDEAPKKMQYLTYKDITKNGLC